MPELPEVETVKETLKQQILNETIEKVEIYYDKIITSPTSTIFKEKIVGQKINAIKRRGKWLLFVLDEDILLSHLRMEGRYYIKEQKEIPSKHVHVVFTLSSGRKLWYCDTRKFGRMVLQNKDEVEKRAPLNALGLEPWDEALTPFYLKEKLKKKTLPIKMVLLDQSIVVGCGNIYANEVLFLSKLHPLRKANTLTKKELENLIQTIRFVLTKAIELGGTTIRSYESSEGVHGRFQNELSIHEQEICPICKEKVIKIFVGGRGTYYCSNCQKNKKL